MPGTASVRIFVLILFSWRLD